MRVLQAHNRHATRGGADVVMDQDRELLTGAGHEVRQLVTEAAEGADLRSATMAVWNHETVRRVKAAVEEFRPDVMHVHTPFPLMSPTVFRAARRLGVPTVATMHSFRYTCIAGTLRRDGAICEDCVGRRLKVPAVRHRCYHDSTAASASLATSLTLHHTIGTFGTRVDRFLTMTDFARDILVRDGVPAEHVRVKPNHVEDPGTPAAWESRGPHVLFSGRLVEEKGIRTLLEGWRRSRHDGFELRVCGDGPLRELVQDAAAADGSVRLLGWLSSERLQEEQRQATLTIVPSEWYEAGPPLVLLESLASRTPVLCSDLENICASVVEHSAGETFRMGDPADLARQLTTLLADDQRMRAAGERGRELYEASHTPAHSLHVLERTYREVLGEGQS